MKDIAKANEFYLYLSKRYDLPKIASYLKFEMSTGSNVIYSATCYEDNRLVERVGQLNLSNLAGSEVNIPLMKYDPRTGEVKPYPSCAEQFREYYGKVAWLYNPYTGNRREAEDVGSDTFGYLISN